MKREILGIVIKKEYKETLLCKFREMCQLTPFKYHVTHDTYPGDSSPDEWDVVNISVHIKLNGQCNVLVTELIKVLNAVFAKDLVDVSLLAIANVTEYLTKSPDLSDKREYYQLLADLKDSKSPAQGFLF
jgi:hypothetical protein